LIPRGGAAPRRPRRRPAPATRESVGLSLAEVSVTTSPEAAEAAGAMLWDLGVTGIVEERRSPGAVRLRCYLPPRRARGILRALRSGIRGLGGYGLEPGRASVTARLIAPRRWARAWRISARSVRVGRLVVAPTWRRVSPRKGGVVIRIDPGMAFGSGAHPSTRLCLRALVRYLRTPRATVVDVGTGSGILAIAAARLGARRVWARDIDPVAVAVARGNVRANGVASAVRVVRGSGIGPVPARCDLVVANITAEAIVALLPVVRTRLAPGGLVLGSGIIDDRLGDVINAARASGLALVGVLASGEWRAVILANRGVEP